MSDAPERIWAILERDDDAPGEFYGVCHTLKYRSRRAEVAFVRADRLAAAEAEIERKDAALGYTLHELRDICDDEETLGTYIAADLIRKIKANARAALTDTATEGQACDAGDEDAAARIIDPDAWHETLPTDGCGAYWMGRRNNARQKAEAVRALIATPATPTVEAARVPQIVARQSEYSSTWFADVRGFGTVCAPSRDALPRVVGDMMADIARLAISQQEGGE